MRPGEGSAPTTMTTARRAIVMVVVALLGAALLDARALDATARQQPFGWRRDAAIALVAPVLAANEALHLDVLRRGLSQALDRPDPLRTEPPLPPAPTPTPTSSPAPTPSPTPTASPPDRAHPLRLRIIGDSMTESFGPSLERLAASTGVIDPVLDLRYSSGLTRPDFFDWPGYTARLLARADHPQVLVVFMGANDAQDIATATGIAHLGTDAWRTEYAKRLRGYFDVIERYGVRCYWIGPPVMGPAYFSERMAVLRSLALTAANGRPGVTFIDSRVPLGGADGVYRAYLPDSSGGLVAVRTADGIHLTRAGADRLAVAVLTAITADFAVAGGGS